MSAQLVRYMKLGNSQIVRLRGFVAEYMEEKVQELHSRGWEEIDSTEFSELEKEYSQPLPLQGRWN